MGTKKGLKALKKRDRDAKKVSEQPKTLNVSRKHFRDLAQAIVDYANDDITILGICGACEASGHAEAVVSMRADDIMEIIEENLDVIFNWVDANDAAVDDAIHSPKEE